MYQYLFDDDTTKKINDSTSKTQSVLEQFADIDKKYIFGKQSDAQISLDRLEFEAPTEQEVVEKATNSLNDYKQKSLDEITSSYNTKNEQINDDIENVTESTNKQKEEIKNAYNQVKQEAKDDAIKRGLARSSIIVNQLENYDNKMLSNLEVLSSQANDKIASLNTQKNTIELEKENALKAFDIEYAIKLQEKIDSINDDIQKNEEAVIKYNNQIAQIEENFKKDIEKENYNREMDMADFIAKNGSYVIETLKRNEKYQLAKEYFADMDKQSAIAELTNNSAFKENLGDTIYNKLLKELQEK